MRHHRRLSIIKNYGHNLRQRKMNILTAIQQHQYAQYFLQNQSSHENNNNFNISQLPQEEQQQIGEQNDGEFSVADYINLLSTEDRQVFKRENPQLPALFFMNKKQKLKYFQTINNNFKKQLQTEPKRASKTKKILKFKNDFVVKPFNQNKKVITISESKEFKEPYHEKIHFS